MGLVGGCGAEGTGPEVMELTAGAPLSSVRTPLRVGCCWPELEVSAHERGSDVRLTLKCFEVSGEISQFLGGLWCVACLLELSYLLWCVGKWTG